MCDHDARSRIVCPIIPVKDLQAVLAGKRTPLFGKFHYGSTPKPNHPHERMAHDRFRNERPLFLFVLLLWLE
jgi:hypothetical protein